MVKDNGHVEQLWQRGAIEPRVGEFHDQYVQLAGAMHDAATLKLLDRATELQLSGAGRGFTTKPFEYNETGESYKANMSAQAHNKQGSDSIFLVVKKDKTSKDPEDEGYYEILSNGVVVNLDLVTVGAQPTVERNTTEYDRVKRAIQKLSENLNDSVQRAIEERHERRVTLGVRAATVLAISGGVAGVIYGVKLIVLDPYERAEAARVAYDTTEHFLPGDPVAIDGYPLELMPQSEFEAIPTFGGSDTTLENPRRIDLATTDNCTTVSIDVPANSRIIVATSESSDFATYSYDTAISPAGLRICIAEVIDTEDPETTPQVAVQVR